MKSAFAGIVQVFVKDIPVGALRLNYDQQW